VLQTSRETLEELHHVCAAKADRLWALRDQGLTRFCALRSLTLHEYPQLCIHWLPRVPVSLQSFTIVVAPGFTHGIVPANTCG